MVSHICRHRAEPFDSLRDARHSLRPVVVHPAPIQVKVNLLFTEFIPSFGIDVCQTRNATRCADRDLTHFASHCSLFQEMIAATYFCLSGLSFFPYITKVTFS